MINRNILFPILFTVIAFACNQPQTQHQDAIIIDTVKSDSLFKPILTDSNYAEKNINDTVTADGWSINYLVKNDDTKYNDIYIKCSKGDKSVIYYGADLIQYRLGFIPSFIGESKSNIFFWYRCATDCQSILVCSKDSVQFKSYPNVVNFDINLGQILYIPDSYYEDPNFEINLVDFTKKKEYKITFDGQAYTSRSESSIDTVIFDKDQVTIRAVILKVDKVKSETKLIKL